MLEYYFKIYCLSCLLVAAPAMAQEKVEALVSDDRPNEGQSITYEIRVTYGNIQSVALTGLDDFEILVGPSTSRSVQIIGGTVSSVSSYQWTLLPKKAGRLVIPALSVRVDGKTRRTNPVTVNVQSVATARGPGKTSKQSNLFLEATIDIEHPYRGQQVTVTWTLYTQVSISGWQIVTIPGLTGFWTENLFTPKTLDLKPIDRDGQRYYSAVVRRMALFPTRSGELEIDPLAMEIGIRSSRRSRRDPFFDDFSFLSQGRVEKKVVASPARTLKIKPVPEKGRPDNYSGVVGQYSLSGGLDYQEVDQDEAVTFSILVSGRGNLKMLKPPEINFPASLEVFDPKISEEPSRGDIVGGTKKLEYVLVPRQAGEIVIPAIDWPFFDPGEGRYSAGTLGPFRLLVRPRTGGLATTTGFSRQEVAILGRDIRFKKSGRPRWLKTGRGWYSTNAFMLNLATVLLFSSPWLSGGAQILFAGMQPGLRRRRALKRALALLDERDDDAGGIYSRIPRAITIYLNLKLNTQVQEYTIEEVCNTLIGEGVESDRIDALRNVLERAAAARFAPQTDGDASADLDAMISSLREVDEQWVI